MMALYLKQEQKVLKTLAKRVIYSSVSKKYEKMALNLVDAITVNSKEGYDYYTKMGFNVVQIPNAIDLNLIPKKSTKPVSYTHLRAHET